MRAVRLVQMMVLSAAILVGVVASADLTLPTLFTDHMVLQRGENVVVWGWAVPGAQVTVSLAGKSATAAADGNGEWKVTLPKMKVGGPHEMTVASGDQTVTIQDILVGEVWVGSGQSNMQWTVSNSANAEQEIAAAAYPSIRLFSVPRVVAGEPQKNVQAQWAVCAPETVPDFSAALFFFGRELHQRLGVPIGLIHTSWGGTPAESWTSREMLERHEVCKPIVERWDQIIADYPQAKAAFDQAMAEWQKQADQAKADGKEEPPKPGAPIGPDHPHRASGLYNAMIAPLINYPICGAIWYQGESNAGRAYQYRTLFPAMITDWREKWNVGDFPFLFVQLANFNERDAEPVESDWAELREAQLMTLDAVDNTGMAVIIDIGEAADIHPKNKQDVGKRLALAAMNKAYKKHPWQRVPWSGPRYKSTKIKGNKVVLSFNGIDGGLVAKGDALKGFAIAGEDKKFVWASAEIKGDKVTVWSDQVEKPVAVRYGWAINPECTLFNAMDLPATPFRTDDWPGVTVDAR